MNPSFPHRMVAVVARIVLAIVEDLPATVADIACLVAAVVSLWLLHRLIVCTAAWIGRHVRRDALDREYAELCESFDTNTPATTPRVRTALKRRRITGVRIPRRPLRRTHSDSKRKARS